MHTFSIRNVLADLRVGRLMRTAGVGVAMALASAQAPAVTLTWNLDGVTFDDGGTATGWFVFDSVGNTVSDWSITVSPWTFVVPDPFSGPDLVTYPAFTYSPTNGGTAGFGMMANGFGRIDWIEPNEVYPGNATPGSVLDRQLRMVFTAPLDLAGERVGIDRFDDFASECWNCAPYRLYTGGSVVAVPEPATWVGMSAGLVMTGFVLARRRRQIA